MVSDFDISKQQPERVGSRLKEWNLLTDGTNIILLLFPDVQFLHIFRNQRLQK